MPLDICLALSSCLICVTLGIRAIGRACPTPRPARSYIRLRRGMPGAFLCRRSTSYVSPTPSPELIYPVLGRENDWEPVTPASPSPWHAAFRRCVTWLSPSNMAPVEDECASRMSIPAPELSSGIVRPYTAPGRAQGQKRQLNGPGDAHPSGKESHGRLMQVLRGLAFAIYMMACCTTYACSVSRATSASPVNGTC